MVEANVSGSATRNGGIGREPLTPAALEADLELRVVRLEHLVAGFGLLLERFQGARAVLGATVFDNFDDPDAGNEALDTLFESAMDARRDLTVLRRDLPILVAAPDPSAGHELLTRLGVLGASATELAGRFEQYRGSISMTVPPRSPGGVGRLDQFVAMVVRALLDIADVSGDAQPGVPRLGLAGSAATHRDPALLVPPRRHQVPGGSIGMPVAGRLWQVLRRRRARLMLEAAGVVVVGLVILVSALGDGGRGPGSIAGGGSASVRPGQSGPGGVALGSGSPSESAPPGASTEPGSSAPPAAEPSSAAPAPAPPGPKLRPAPTPKPALAAASVFKNRLLEAAGSIDGLLSTITTALQEAAFPTVKAAADEIATIATRERSWLRSHPSKACYDSFQEAAVARYTDLIATATAIAADADAGDANAIHKEVASAHGDVSALKQAGNRAVASCA